MEVRLATATCVQCGLDWNDHLDEAAEHIAKALRADMGAARDHLQLWWAEALKWAGNRPIWKAGAALEDVALAEQALHILAQGQLPLDGGSSKKLHNQSKVTVELAARGLGPAGSAPVPPDVWDEWAEPDFGGAGMRVGALPPSGCPKVAALLQTLHGQGLVDLVDGAANAEVFAKWKNERKCAVIVNIRMYNHRSCFKARRFKLPSLEALAVLMRTCAGASGPCHEGGLWGAKVDIANCYWSVCLPPDLAGAIRVAAGNRTYTLLRVPFGWHRAPCLVQALIADLLRDLDPDGVVAVQYLDDMLFIGRDRAQVAAVAEDAAYTVRRAGFLVSVKSELEPQRRIAWMGKAGGPALPAAKLGRPGQVRSGMQTLPPARARHQGGRTSIQAVGWRSGLPLPRRHGRTSGGPPWRPARGSSGAPHTCRLWEPHTPYKTPSGPCWLARDGSAWAVMPREGEGRRPAVHSGRPCAPLQQLVGGTASLVVRQSSALLSSKNETVHRDARSLGLQLAASPTWRSATKERTANPSTSQSQLVRTPFAMVDVFPNLCSFGPKTPVIFPRRAL